MQLADIFAEAYRIDLVELDRMVGELIRIRDERQSEADEEANRANGSSDAPDAAPNGRK